MVGHRRVEKRQAASIATLGALLRMATQQQQQGADASNFSAGSDNALLQLSASIAPPAPVLLSLQLAARQRFAPATSAIADEDGVRPAGSALQSTSMQSGALPVPRPQRVTVFIRIDDAEASAARHRTSATTSAAAAAAAAYFRGAHVALLDDSSSGPYFDWVTGTLGSGAARGPPRNGQSGGLRSGDFSSAAAVPWMIPLVGPLLERFNISSADADVNSAIAAMSASDRAQLLSSLFTPSAYAANGGSSYSSSCSSRSNSSGDSNSSDGSIPLLSVPVGIIDVVKSLVKEGGASLRQHDDSTTNNSSGGGGINANDTDASGCRWRWRDLTHATSSTNMTSSRYYPTAIDDGPGSWLSALMRDGLGLTTTNSSDRTAAAWWDTFLILGAGASAGTSASNSSGNKSVGSSSTLAWRYAAQPPPNGLNSLGSRSGGGSGLGGPAAASGGTLGFSLWHSFPSSELFPSATAAAATATTGVTPATAAAATAAIDTWRDQWDCAQSPPPNSTAMYAAASNSSVPPQVLSALRDWRVFLAAALHADASSHTAATTGVGHTPVNDTAAAHTAPQYSDSRASPVMLGVSLNADGTWSVGSGYTDLPPRPLTRPTPLSSSSSEGGASACSRECPHLAPPPLPRAEYGVGWHKLDIFIHWNSSTARVRVNDVTVADRVNFSPGSGGITRLGLWAVDRGDSSGSHRRAHTADRAGGRGGGGGDDGITVWFDEVFAGEDATMDFTCPDGNDRAIIEEDDENVALGSYAAALARAPREAVSDALALLHSDDSALQYTAPGQQPSNGWSSSDVGPPSYDAPITRHDSHLSERPLYTNPSHGGLVFGDGVPQPLFVNDALQLLNSNAGAGAAPPPLNARDPLPGAQILLSEEDEERVAGAALGCGSDDEDDCRFEGAPLDVESTSAAFPDRRSRSQSSFRSAASAPPPGRNYWYTHHDNPLRSSFNSITTLASTAAAAAAAAAAGATSTSYFSPLVHAQWYASGGVGVCSRAVGSAMWRFEGIGLFYANVTNSDGIAPEQLPDPFTSQQPPQVQYAAIAASSGSSGNVDPRTPPAIAYHVRFPSVAVNRALLFNHSSAAQLYDWSDTSSSSLDTLPPALPFVMWSHADDDNSSRRMAGVAASAHPGGPFSFLWSVLPNGNYTTDLTLLQVDVPLSRRSSVPAAASCNSSSGNYSSGGGGVYSTGSWSFDSDSSSDGCGHSRHNYSGSSGGGGGGSGARTTLTFLVRSYYATTRYLVPAPVMQPLWESVKKASVPGGPLNVTDFALGYHRAYYSPGYDNPDDTLKQIWRMEGTQWNISIAGGWRETCCTQPDTSTLGSSDSGNFTLTRLSDGLMYSYSPYHRDATLMAVLGPNSLHNVLGQARPPVFSRYLDPLQALNSAWAPSSVPAVKAQAWGQNYRDKNIADNPPHPTVPDLLIGDPVVALSRRAAYIAISPLTADLYNTTGGSMRVIEGQADDGAALVTMLTAMAAAELEWAAPWLNAATAAAASAAPLLSAAAIATGGNSSSNGTNASMSAVGSDATAAPAAGACDLSVGNVSAACVAAILSPSSTLRSSTYQADVTASVLGLTTASDWQDRFWQYTLTPGDRALDFRNFRDRQWHNASASGNCPDIHHSALLLYAECEALLDVDTVWTTSPPKVNYLGHLESYSLALDTSAYESCLAQHAALLASYAKCLAGEVSVYK